MESTQLPLDDGSSGDAKPKRRGPPNRMNDLPYKDWMKFQKSFFRSSGDEQLVGECVRFFTKAEWPDGLPSRSLLVGFEDLNADSLLLERAVDVVSLPVKLAELSTRVPVDHRGAYDFILMDLRERVTDEASLTRFLESDSDAAFVFLRTQLAPDRYCGVLVGQGGPGGSRFPLPWSIALSGRPFLRLRDEKVGLVEADGSVFYCLFFQSNDDEMDATEFSPETVDFRASDRAIPAWTIPRPPPRKPNEILHPAKYPEPLVEEFVQMFTEEGDSVFDPMVGTGSTVVAALRQNRTGVGVDLIQEFVDIAMTRAEGEAAPTLFSDGDTVEEFAVFQGDSTDLSAIDGIKDRTFDYCITSPPYWSMLANKGSEYQKKRRSKNLRLVYSDDERDLGNVTDYNTFLELLDNVYGEVSQHLSDDGVLTVVVKNVKRNHVVYPLAWDLVARLAGPEGSYSFIGTTFWCQDDVGLKPFAVGISWVSNTLHQYCLHFAKRTQGESIPKTLL